MNGVLDFDPAFVDRRTPRDLRQTETLKWNSFPPDTIGAFVAEMDLGTAPAIQAALHELVDREVYGYTPVRLSRELSEACSSWQRDAYGWHVPAEQIFPIVDIKTALEQTILHLSAPGSSVIVPTPGYSSFAVIPRALGREVIEVPMLREDGGRWEFDLQGIAAAFRAGGQILVLCNPHNPTGRVHNADELLALSQVVEEYGGRVFSDEIHSPMVYPGQTHIPYASLSETTARHTITAVSTSKSWNTPGLKCAQVIVSNAEDLDKWQRVSGFSVYGASNFGIVASTVAYSAGRGWLAGAIDYLDRNRMLIADVLHRDLPSVRYDPPQATYLAWLDFRDTKIAASPEEVLREGARVAIMDGASFGEIGRGWVRLNFAMPTPLLEEALERIVTFVKSSTTR